MKYLIFLLALAAAVYLLAYHNAMAVGITHEQAVAFWYRQLICVGIGAAVVWGGSAAYVIISSRKKKE